MISRALFVIDADPRASGRPAEAVRIAAGVGVWKKIEVALYLRAAAVLILGEDTCELVDQENYTRYLPILGEFGRPIFVQEGAPALSRLGQSLLPIQQISDAVLARLAAESSCVIRF
jgi:sulfur relay (sulfurtransferase) DsrF/TusC family protein